MDLRDGVSRGRRSKIEGFLAKFFESLRGCNDRYRRNGSESRDIVVSAAITAPRNGSLQILYKVINVWNTIAC